MEAINERDRAIIPILEDRVNGTYSVRIGPTMVRIVEVFTFVGTQDNRVSGPIHLVRVVSLARRPFALYRLSFRLPTHAVCRMGVAPSIPFKGPGRFFSIVRVVPVIIVVVSRDLHLLVRRVASEAINDARFTGSVALVPTLIRLRHRHTTIFTPANRIRVRLVFVEDSVRHRLLTHLRVRRRQRMGERCVPQLHVITPLRSQLLLTEQTKFSRQGTTFLRITRFRNYRLPKIKQPSSQPAIVARVHHTVRHRNGLFL